MFSRLKQLLVCKRAPTVKMLLLHFGRFNNSPTTFMLGKVAYSKVGEQLSHNDAGEVLEPIASFDVSEYTNLLPVLDGASYIAVFGVPDFYYELENKSNYEIRVYYPEDDLVPSTYEIMESTMFRVCEYEGTLLQESEKTALYEESYYSEYEDILEKAFGKKRGQSIYSTGIIKIGGQAFAEQQYLPTVTEKYCYFPGDEEYEFVFQINSNLEADFCIDDAGTLFFFRHKQTKEWHVTKESG